MDMFINQRIIWLRSGFLRRITTLLCNTVSFIACFIHTVYFSQKDYMWVRNTLTWYLCHHTTKLFGMTLYYLSHSKRVLVPEAPRRRNGTRCFQVTKWPSKFMSQQLRYKLNILLEAYSKDLPMFGCQCLFPFVNYFFQRSHRELDMIGCFFFFY